MCFLDGTLTCSNDDSPELDEWDTMNSLIQSWIFNTIDATTSQQVTNMENAKDIWDELKSRFFVEIEHRSLI